jgi:hypothetical protein
MHAEHSTFELEVMTIRSKASSERRMRKTDVGSQSADPTEFCFKPTVGNGSNRPLEETAPALD